MKHHLLFFLLLLMSVYAMAGNRWKIEGFVLDSKSKEPIPFVNIIISGKLIGTTTDVDGHFSLSVEEANVILKFSHISHEEKLMDFQRDGAYPVRIMLHPIVYELAEVAIHPAENPAHRIIDSLVAHAPENDPKKISSYTCTIYEKLMVTIDTVSFKKMELSADSEMVQMHDYLSEHDLLILENVLEKTFIAPDRNYHKITASKMSGIKEPFFVATLTQLQSISLYDPTFRIGTRDYVSPVSKGSPKRYFFLLEDTTYSERGDTIFMISYRPRKGATFNGLQGILSVNSNGWALQNATATPTDMDTAIVEIQLREMYRRLENGRWFPAQVHTDYIIKKISFIGDPVDIKAIGRTYYSNAKTDLAEKPKRLGEVGIELLPGAGKKDSLFWAEHRILPLSEKEQNTYHFIDSLAEAEHLDKLFKMMPALMDLKIPIWKFDLELDKIINYQEYQGFYLGLGISTNMEFSKVFELGGFGGYGFKDKKSKYGGYGSVMFYRPKNVNLNFSYTYDGFAVGRESFYQINKSLLSSEYYEQFFINRVDYTESIGGSIFADPIPYLQSEIGFYHDFRMPSYDYVFEPTGQTDFEITSLQLKLRYAFRESRLSLPFKRQILFSLRNPYPVVSLNYTHSFQNVLNGDFDYNRIEFKVQQSLYWQNIGQTQFVLHGGVIFEEVPYSLLFDPASTYLRSMTIFSQNSFATMRRNEFVNDRSLSLFFSHRFKNLFYKPSERVRKYFDFQPAVITNIGWGMLRNPENHSGIDIKDMHLGYFESGIMFERLLFRLNLGFMYRYGAYRVSNFSDNLVVMIKFGW